MPNHQAIRAVRFFLIILIILIIRKRQQAACFNRILNQNRRDEEEAWQHELELILQASLEPPRTRRCWVEARNSAWIDGVLDGSLLQGKRFEKMFRMSRESFFKLHNILGTTTKL
jgi:hypothetical protein